MAGHFMTLAAVLVQADPRPPSLRVNIRAAHLHGCADAGEGKCILGSFIPISLWIWAPEVCRVVYFKAMFKR
jgi:hypothetical protein